MEFRTTQAGVTERIGETRWMSPAHLVTAFGKTFPGIRAARIPEAMGALSDRAIDKYVEQGYYEGRSSRYIPGL